MPNNHNLKRPLSINSEGARSRIQKPLTLKQTELMEAYKAIDPQHYDKIEKYISKGMCYGYTILWLDSMRAHYNRKLINIDASLEQKCFFKIIEILNKYHQTPEAIPQDTKKTLKDTFDTLVEVQKAQSPDVFFKRNSENVFFTFLPDYSNDANETLSGTDKNAYLELYNALTSLPAGTCIEVFVPRHAIGLYISIEEIFLLDPNEKEVAKIPMHRTNSHSKNISVFDEQSGFSLFLDKMGSIVVQNYYCKKNKSNSKIIQLNVLTPCPESDIADLKTLASSLLSCNPDEMQRLIHNSIKDPSDTNRILGILDCHLYTPEGKESLKLELLEHIYNELNHSMLDLNSTKYITYILNTIGSDQAFKTKITSKLLDTKGNATCFYPNLYLLISFNLKLNVQKHYSTKAYKTVLSLALTFLNTTNQTNSNHPHAEQEQPKEIELAKINNQSPKPGP